MSGCFSNRLSLVRSSFAARPPCCLDSSPYSSSVSASLASCHKPFDDLLVKAKQISDVAERTKLYEQAQLIFKEEAPWSGLATGREATPPVLLF